jgi:hypothetical protein
MNDAKISSEVSSRLSTSVGKSKYSFRLFFFTLLSILACAAALANVAAAATPSGEDQYVEKVPTGSGDTKEDTSVDVIDANGDGVITEAEVKDAAEKKKAKAKKDKAKSEDEGASGATGAVAGSTTTPTPPAAESVATAAKLGPFSRNTALLIGALALLAGLGAVAFGGAGSSFLGSGGGSDSSSPTPPAH